MASVRIGSGAFLWLTFQLAVMAAGAEAQASHAVVRLKPGDQIEVQIKNEPVLSGRYAITPQGDAMLPLVGRVVVADRPFEEVEAEVRAEYARELAEPDVLIVALQRVSVLGEVRAPGMHWVDPTGTVRDVFVLSGGFSPSANRGRIELIRGETTTRLEVQSDGAPPAIPVRSGDQLVIGKRGWLSENTGLFIGAAATVAAAAVTSLIIRR
jgi:protein involved in polysaccharide export with SLBB domain